MAQEAQEEWLVAEFANLKTAKLGLEVLAKAGYGKNQVSFISRSDDPALAEIVEVDEKAHPDVEGSSKVAAGGLVGGAISAPLAAGTLLGNFILLGPLVGAGLGAMVGAMLAGSRRWGEARQPEESYEKNIEQGASLIVVTGSELELDDAEASLKTAGPRSIERYLPTST
jgi:uncharacterized membrane protein